MPNKVKLLDVRSSAHECLPEDCISSLLENLAFGMHSRYHISYTKVWQHSQKMTQEICSIAIILKVPENLISSQEKLHSCPAVLELRKSLEAEREAVFYFLFTAVDETLTPAQEAYLDIRSYPWCPDIWAISELMAERRKVSFPERRKSLPQCSVLHGSISCVLGVNSCC